jgi:hypothetical protein
MTKWQNRPANWREWVAEEYENGGESIGRLLLHRPDLEPEIWKLLGPTKIYPRWMLKSFRYEYRKRNPSEWGAKMSKQRTARRRLQGQQDSLDKLHGRLHDMLGPQPPTQENPNG